MCISSSFKKFRSGPCNKTSTIINSLNFTFDVFNFSSSISFVKQNQDEFCVYEHKGDNSPEYPWYTPELDIHNQNHLIIYKSNDSDNEVDYPETAFPNKIWIVKPAEEIIMKTSLFVPLILWGIFANMCLLYIILKHRYLRSPTNMVIANMAIVDLISLIIYPWVFLTTDFFQNYQFGPIGCKMDGWLEFSLLLINIMNLATITYDRLSAIVLPNETKLTRRGAKIVITVSWIVAFILASPLMIFRTYKNRQWKNFLEIYCTEDVKILAIYWHILLMMAVWIPLAVMMICYTAIFIKLDRYEQKVLKREHPLSVCYKTKVAKVVFIVVITFIICRTPLTALIFRRNQWLKDNKRNQILGAHQILFFVSRYLIYTNAALDPLLYGLTNENFRRAFRTTPITKIFFPKKKKTPNPDKVCVNIIQPRGPYRMDFKSDKEPIIPFKETTDTSKDKSNLSSPNTDIKNMMLN